MSHHLKGDLDHILKYTEGVWDSLRGQRLFMTGGTGFFGCWLLESFLWATTQLNLDATVCVLSRDPEAFRRKAPHLANHPAIQLVAGDVRSFEFPDGIFSHVIHAGADPSALLNRENPDLVLETIVQGTARVLDFAQRCQATTVLFVSSGAVYGPQPQTLSRIPEEFLGGPDPVVARSAYAEGKRVAELLCVLEARRHGFAAKIARCFAFLGPYQPLEGQFAIGNFTHDAINRQPIQVAGDGTPSRSYLYAADLAIWLWTILIRGESCRPYNVGSEQSVTIAQLAELVAGRVESPVEVRIKGRPTPGRPAERYVPSTRRAQSELGLQQTIALDEAIHKNLQWHREAAPMASSIIPGVQ